MVANFILGLINSLIATAKYDLLVFRRQPLFLSPYIVVEIVCHSSNDVFLSKRSDNNDSAYFLVLQPRPIRDHCQYILQKPRSRAEVVQLGMGFIPLD
jgi:hypothetical protein